MIQGKFVSSHQCQTGLGKDGRWEAFLGGGTGGNEDYKQKGKPMDLTRLVGPVPLPTDPRSPQPAACPRLSEGKEAASLPCHSRGHGHGHGR